MNAYSKTILVMFLADALVFVAMAVDLASGLNKAKQRGEIRSSWGLKRTLSKLIMYEGAMIITHGIDALMQASHILKLLGLEALDAVPFFTCVVGVFLLVVEALSVYESADRKTQTELSRVATAAGEWVSKESLVEALAQVLAMREGEGKVKTRKGKKTHGVAAETDCL